MIVFQIFVSDAAWNTKEEFPFIWAISWYQISAKTNMNSTGKKQEFLICNTFYYI